MVLLKQATRVLILSRFFWMPTKYRPGVQEEFRIRKMVVKTFPCCSVLGSRARKMSVSETQMRKWNLAVTRFLLARAARDAPLSPISLWFWCRLKLKM